MRSVCTANFKLLHITEQTHGSLQMYAWGPKWGGGETWHGVGRKKGTRSIEEREGDEWHRGERSTVRGRGRWKEMCGKEIHT